MDVQWIDIWRIDDPLKVGEVALEGLISVVRKVSLLTEVTRTGLLHERHCIGVGDNSVPEVCSRMKTRRRGLGVRSHGKRRSESG